MFNSLRIVALLAATLLCGCAVTDRFDARLARYDLAAAQARDTMILTNIVRASRAEPLSFVQLGQLSGTSQTSANLGLPGFALGPHPASLPALKDAVFGAFPGQGNGYAGNSANVMGSTSFQATPSETRDFYRGLLQEVDPRTLSLFIQQDISREVLFYLFTDRIIEIKGGVRRQLRNDPLDTDFPDFRHYVGLAMKYGLASEPIGKQDANPDPARHRPRPWRLCFSQLYMAKNAPPAANAPICGAGGRGGDDERSVSFNARNGERVTLQILPRSAFAIFEYLGRIVAAGDSGRIPLVSQEAIDAPPLRDPYLFTVVSGDAAGCFVATVYEGQSYCVPRDGAANTKRILGLLTQILALNTAIEDVPVAPTVRVIP